MTLRWILFGTVGTLRGRLATALGKWCEKNSELPGRIDRLAPEHWRPQPMNATEKSLLGEIKQAPYAVAGAPRHTSWKRRRRELEQAARTKRRQLESFREEA